VLPTFSYITISFYLILPTLTLKVPTMADSPLTAVKTYQKPSHDSTTRFAHRPGQPAMWEGKPRPITQTHIKLCQARDVPDMDAFSRLQVSEHHHRIFNHANHTPTEYLTKGTH